jgi:2-oxoglutarate dehydrogenase complex dehydrogenase (E1) component-like enzyme
MACAIVPPVTRRIDHDDPRLTAPDMAARMATETLMDVVTSADLLQKAIINDNPVEQQKIIEVARAQFEAYLDLMAEAAHHARALKP